MKVPMLWQTIDPIMSPALMLPGMEQTQEGASSGAEPFERFSQICVVHLSGFGPVLNPSRTRTLYSPVGR